MPPHNSTVEYAATQLRRMDWIIRHKWMARLQVKKPKVYDEILKIMTPDEMLDGKDTMPALAENTVIVMKNRPKMKHLVQTKLTKYFKLIRRRRLNVR